VVAKQLVESLRRQPAAWAIPWPCLNEFIAIATQQSRRPFCLPGPQIVRTAFIYGRVFHEVPSNVA
jgi:hypothetical protein